MKNIIKLLIVFCISPLSSFASGDSTVHDQKCNFFGFSFGIGKTYPTFNTDYDYDVINGNSWNFGFFYERVLTKKFSLLAEAQLVVNLESGFEIYRNNLPPDRRNDFLRILIYPNSNINLAFGAKYNFLHPNSKKNLLSADVMLGFTRSNISIWRHESFQGFPYSPFPNKDNWVNLAILKLNISNRIHVGKKLFIAPMLSSQIMLHNIKSPEIKVWTPDYSDKESRFRFNTFLYGFQIGF